MKKLTRDELASQVATLSQEVMNLRKSNEIIASARSTAECNVAKLKEQLFEASIKLARLQGYRERIESDDKANAELVTVERRVRNEYTNEPMVEVTQVPKRELGSFDASLHQTDGYIVEYDEDRYGHSGRKEKSRTHWVNL